MKRWGALCLWSLLITLPGAPAQAMLRALVVAGLGGEDGYETRFQRDAKRTADALRTVSTDVTLLLGDMSHREALIREVGELLARSQGTDVALLVLIGHGTFDDRSYRFNVPGPDLTGEELAGLLGATPAGRQVVVVATSSSGALQEPLAAPGRTVLTATRSGAERNASVFAQHLSASLADSSADTDKNDHVSLAEAFQFAEAGVAEHYRSRGEMQSEHPALSAQLPALSLARLETEQAPAPVPPAILELERAIDELRAGKSGREPDQYYADLQKLLLELAVARRRAGLLQGQPEAAP